MKGAPPQARRSPHRFLDAFFAARPEVLNWGAASLDKPLPHADRLSEWVGGGMHAGLRYMQERLEERREPRRLVPWARSAVLFALRQPAPFGTDTGDFKIAAYALGDDYHKIARSLLAELEEKFREAAPAARFQGFCDTWPVFERDLAAEAGLGWRGKNACLIHPRHGSGFLLAGFFTDSDLAPSPAPLQDFCGGCTACLDHCPTGALTEPGRLDANKCLSYWTIEAKGPVPEEIAGKTSGWIFGCDICQDVCPWNRKQKKSAQAAQAAAASSAAGSTPDESSGGPAEPWPRTAREWLALLRKQGGFQGRFRRTPLARAGRKAMLRNVLLALRPEHGDFGGVLAALETEEDDPALRAALERLRPD